MPFKDMNDVIQAIRDGTFVRRAGPPSLSAEDGDDEVSEVLSPVEHAQGSLPDAANSTKELPASPLVDHE